MEENTADNYQDRVVGRYEIPSKDYPDEIIALISTAMVYDGFKPYETAVAHPQYRHGRLIVVEAYATREEAVVGHEEWVKIMTTKPLPERLTDVTNCAIGVASKLAGLPYIFERT